MFDKKEKQTYYPVSEMHGQNTVVDSLWIQYVYTSFVLTKFITSQLSSVVARGGDGICLQKRIKIKLNNESETNTTVIVV